MLRKTLKIILFVILAVISVPTVGQNVKSMELDLAKTQSDTAKISLLLHISSAYNKLENFEKAYQNAEKSLHLSENTKNYKIGRCLLAKAIAADKIGRSHEAQALYEKSLIYLNNNKETPYYIDALKGLAGVLMTTENLNSALTYNLRALEVSKKIGDSRRMADNLKNIGMVFSKLKKADKALKYYNDALEIYELSDNNEGVVKCLLNISYVHIDKKEWEKALETTQKALEINKITGNHLLEASAYNIFSIIYKNQGSIDKAFDNILRSYEIFEEKNYQLGMTICLVSMSNLALETGDTASSHKYLDQCLKIAKQSSFKLEIQSAYKGLSDLYLLEKDYQKSLENFKKYSNFRDSILNENISQQVLELSAKYENTQKEDEIKRYKMLKNMAIILFSFFILFVLSLFYVLYKKSKTVKLLQYQQNQNLSILDTLNKQKNEIQKQTQQLKETNLELEKLSLVAKKTDNTILIADVDGDVEWVNESFIKTFAYTEKDLNFINYEDKIVTEIVRVLHEGILKCREANKPYLFSFNFRDSQKGKHWYQTSVSPIFNTVGEIIKFIVIGSDITQIKMAEIEINIQHAEIEAQRDQIFKQNTEIMASILYSERIQKAVLPPLEFFHEIFSEAFIIYKPKDIVSGDFFWATAKNEKKIIAVADCTGHGVPGAFMSMLGIVLLNEIVNKHQDLLFEFNLSANQILNLLRSKLKKSLHQKGISGEAHDGIDIALCIIDNIKNEIQFSGANMPIFISNNEKVQKCKGDRMPIGIYTEKDSEFMNFNISFQKGDILYIASDGYSDQFGGPIDKKFLVRNFREMLASIYTLSMEQQKQIISDIFDGWRGEIEQTDDITVVGIKL